MNSELADAPQPGDLLLFYGGRQLGWWIERVTRSPFYHVALYDADGYVVDAVPRGVVRRPLADGTTGTRFVVARVPGGRGEAALAWAKAQIGRPFDAPGMLVVLASLALPHCPIRYHPTRRFTCSHLVVAAFRAAGIDLAPGRNPALVTPDHFALLASPETISHAWREGRARDRQSWAR
jgi:uncharacterized protein YycO